MDWSDDEVIYAVHAVRETGKPSNLLEVSLEMRTLDEPAVRTILDRLVVEGRLLKVDATDEYVPNGD
jgi:hypothetical protein